MPKIIAKKQDWINLGYKLFSKNGISGIIIEKMAEKLNVNKSSFYWHFKTKNIFIEQLILFWAQNETEQIIELANNEKTATEKFKILISVIYKQNPFLDFVFYLKRYAIKKTEIQNIIEKIDSQRVEYVKNLLHKMQYSEKEAKIKSSLLYKHLIGYHEIIRNKKQSTDYIKGVKIEINEFIKY